MEEPRKTIVHRFAVWTAMRSARGVKLSSRRGIMGIFGDPEVIRRIEDLCEGRAGVRDRSSFDEFHHKICDEMLKPPREYAYGWVAKVLNVYLKTRVYVGRDGPPGLDRLLHPPIDNGLWNALKKEKSTSAAIRMHRTAFTRIKNTTSYPEYEAIIEGLKACRKEWNKGTLFELEVLWPGVDAAAKGKHGKKRARTRRGRA